MCVTSGRFGREMIADPYAVYPGCSFASPR